MAEDRSNILEKAVLALAFAVCVALGACRARYPYNDLLPSYAGERCLLHGCDPYGGTRLLYPPSSLMAMAPLGLFNFRTAWLLWFVLNSGLLLVAVILVAGLCPREDRRLATVLGAIVLAGSSQLLSLAQPSALAISLAAIGGSCLIRGRMLWMSAAALMLSLAVKPQIGGLLAVYWAVRGPHRRVAIAAIAGALALFLGGILILNVRPTSARWAAELRANLSGVVAPGGTGDPRPANLLAPATLNLQTVTSAFSADEKIYDGAAYTTFALLLAVWVAAAMRMKPGATDDLLSMGALAVLTLLPVYHRSYDSRLLLLALPAGVIVLRQRRSEGLLLCALIASATVSFQHWMQLALTHAGLLADVLNHKVLLIALLRESDLRLLLCFGLLLLAALRRREPEDGAERRSRAGRRVTSLAVR